MNIISYKIIPKSWESGVVYSKDMKNNILFIDNEEALN